MFTLALCLKTGSLKKRVLMASLKRNNIHFTICMITHLLEHSNIVEVIVRRNFYLPNKQAFINIYLNVQFNVQSDGQWSAA